MASQTVPTAPSGGPSQAAKRPPLWQAPLFVLGVGALVTVFLSRPIFPDAVSHRLDRDLATARAILARPDGDGALALRLAQQALDKAAEQAPNRLGEAQLLVGTAEIRLADNDPAGSNSEHWKAAWHHLQEAQQAGVPEDLQPRLTYRLGKVGFYTGDELGRVIERLEASADHGDNRAEAYGLLTQAYLRQAKPDLVKALEANRKLREATVTDAELAEAQLLGAELLARQGKLDDARRTLDLVAPAVKPELRLKALLLRARTYQDEKNWGEAVNGYRSALADAKGPLPATIYFNLGVCCKQNEDSSEAARAWQECIKLSDGGPEGQVAALYLADLADPASIKEGVEALAAVLKPLHSAGDWKNPIVDLAGARNLCEHIQMGLRQLGRFDLALKVVELYEKLALPGRTLELRGEVYADWARAHRETAAKATGADVRQAEERESNKLYLQAAQANAEAARTPGILAGQQTSLLWASAGQYLASGEFSRASEQLESVLKLDSDPARQGEGWYRLAEAYRSQGNPKQAEPAYLKCIEFPTRFAFLARYQIALLKLEGNDPDEAATVLKYNVNQLRINKDPEALEKSLFKLGELLYDRHSYQEAVRFLEEAVQQFKDNPGAPTAQFQLADTYRQIANQENMSSLINENMTPEKRAHFQREHRRWLQKAADEFARLDAFLDSPSGQEALTREQRIQVPFVTAKCWFNLGEFQKSLRIYERLIERYKDKVEVLDALGGAVSCHAALADESRVQQRLIQILDVTSRMDRSVAAPWIDWVKRAQMGMKNNTAASPAH